MRHKTKSDRLSPKLLHSNTLENTIRRKIKLLKIRQSFLILRRTRKPSLTTSLKPYLIKKYKIAISPQST